MQRSVTRAWADWKPLRKDWRTILGGILGATLFVLVGNRWKLPEGTVTSVLTSLVYALVGYLALWPLEFLGLWAVAPYRIQRDRANALDRVNKSLTLRLEKYEVDDASLTIEGVSGVTANSHLLSLRVYVENRGAGTNIRSDWQVEVRAIDGSVLYAGKGDQQGGNEYIPAGGAVHFNVVFPTISYGGAVADPATLKDARYVLTVSLVRGLNLRAEYP